ncbi:MAG: TlpA family protein disulfide reductase [Bacteroidetes Order II. Incertae sedis bacterium]|nr:TlpA family protein disulfide reductase [Bacteroidetes Order II. bacterium]
MRYILGLILLVAACRTEAQPAPEMKDYAGLMSEIKQRDASLVVLNFWATWCVPCVEEFPHFIRLKTESDPKEISVMFVSVDFEDEMSAVVTFLKKQHVQDRTFMADGDANTFIQSFHKSWSGAVPATFVYNRKGEQLDFWEGKVTYEQLAEKINRLKTPKTQSP